MLVGAAPVTAVYPNVQMVVICPQLISVLTADLPIGLHVEILHTEA